MRLSNHLLIIPSQTHLLSRSYTKTMNKSLSRLSFLFSISYGLHISFHRPLCAYSRISIPYFMLNSILIQVLFFTFHCYLRKTCIRACLKNTFCQMCHISYCIEMLILLFFLYFSLCYKNVNDNTCTNIYYPIESKCF